MSRTGVNRGDAVAIAAHSVTSPCLYRDIPGMNRGYISHRQGLHRGDVGTVRMHFIFKKSVPIHDER